MPMVIIFILCCFETYAGVVGTCLVAEAKGNTAKRLNKFDAESRKQRDTEPRKGGTGRGGNMLHNARWSRSFVPRNLTKMMAIVLRKLLAWPTLSCARQDWDGVL